MRCAASSTAASHTGSITTSTSTSLRPRLPLRGTLVRRATSTARPCSSSSRSAAATRSGRASGTSSNPLLWRGARAGEPSWETVLGVGRPGWHIECSVIAQEFLDLPLTVNGGGADLVFPHHEFSAGHTAALTGRPLANLYSHTGLVAYRGKKMSKSLDNLVLVSTLTGSGVDARA